MRRPIFLALGLPLALATAWVVWAALGHPPLPVVLRLGDVPACAPTGRTITVEGAEFVEIGPGCFRIGAVQTRAKDVFGRVSAAVRLPRGRRSLKGPVWYTRPARWVSIPDGFWIARRLVPDPESGTAGEAPASPVTWAAAKAWCDGLARRSGLPVRMPSEAEWEICMWSGLPLLPETGDRVLSGSREPNAWGLFGLMGPESEWCEDAGNPDYDGVRSDGRPWAAAPGGDAPSPHLQYVWFDARISSPGPIVMVSLGDFADSTGIAAFRPAFRLEPGEEDRLAPFLEVE